MYRYFKKRLSCLDSALALDGIGAIIENELRNLIEKCLHEAKLREMPKEENNQWLSNYIRVGLQYLEKYSNSIISNSLN